LHDPYRVENHDSGPEGAVRIDQGSTLGQLQEHGMPQSLGAIYIHVIFSTKHREPLILDAWRNDLFDVLGGLTNQTGCQSLIVGGVADHVHLLFQLSRTKTVADTIGQVKSLSSSWVNQNRQPNGSFQWQAGYAALSVCTTNLESVREYIRGQPEHHQQQSFQNEYREWLQRYGLMWDERYVWD
jgi:putative transposase